MWPLLASVVSIKFDKPTSRSFMKLLQHWQEYVIEAAGLGVFMVSAGVFATILYSPASTIAQNLANQALLQGLLMGVAMGVTAIGIIYSPWGKRSGAHINPAVTITFFRLGKIEPWDTFCYIIAQFIGGLAGVLLVAILPWFSLHFTNPENVNYAVTIPGSYGWLVAMIAEFIISFGLMTMVLFTSNNEKLAPYTGIFAGFLVATYITFEAPISGMSMNPARTFASSLPADTWNWFWIYYFAPPLAMLSAAEMYLRIGNQKRQDICCKLCPNSETPCISEECCTKCRL